MDDFYGDPRGKGGKESKDWVKKYLTTIMPPWKMIYVENARQPSFGNSNSTK